MKIKLNCRKAWERLKGGYKLYVASKHVKIYIPNGVHVNSNNKKLSMSTLVEILCYGVGKIPPRNFIVDVPKYLRKDVYKFLREHTDLLLRNATNPYNLGEIYANLDTDVISMKVTSMVKQCILDGFYSSTVPNAPRTVQNKGFNLPLVETGALVNSITAKIEDTE